MGVFSNFKTANDGIEKDGDRSIGGLFDSDVYTGKVKLAYHGTSPNGAHFIEVHLDINGKQFRTREYITNRDGDNTYPVKKDGKPTGERKFMPGFEKVDDFCLVTTGYGLVDLEADIEEKTVNLWDFDLKKEVPTNVPCLIPAMGQDVSVAIERLQTDVTKKNDATGKYEPTGEKKEINEVAKWIHAESDRTVAEITGDVAEPVWAEAWLNRSRGKVRDVSKGASGNSGAPGRPNATAGNAGAPGGGDAPAKKAGGLFNKK